MELEGWLPDPFGIHEERLYRRGAPTPLVRDDGIGWVDPPPPPPGASLSTAHILPASTGGGTWVAAYAPEPARTGMWIEAPAASPEPPRVPTDTWPGAVDTWVEHPGAGQGPPADAQTWHAAPDVVAAVDHTADHGDTTDHAVATELGDAGGPDAEFFSLAIDDAGRASPDSLGDVPGATREPADLFVRAGVAPAAAAAAEREAVHRGMRRLLVAAVALIALGTAVVVTGVGGLSPGPGRSPRAAVAAPTSSTVNPFVRWRLALPDSTTAPPVPAAVQAGTTLTSIEAVLASLPKTPPSTTPPLALSTTPSSAPTRPALPPATRPTKPRPAPTTSAKPSPTTRPVTTIAPTTTVAPTTTAGPTTSAPASTTTSASASTTTTKPVTTTTTKPSTTTTSS